MITKYTKKPIPNPNEADLSRQVVPNPLYGVRDLLIPAVILNVAKNPFFLWSLVSFLWSASKNKPNFKTEKTPISRQKRRNGGQKPTQKNETNPILTGA
jgi:hypothetical protein